MVTRKAADKFPLWLHPRGSWCKKHRGQFHDFGADKEGALKRFVAEWDDIKAGRTTRSQRGNLPLAALANAFRAGTREKVQAGDLSARFWEDFHLAYEKVIDCFGRLRIAIDLRPEDFGKLRASVAKRLGPAPPSWAPNSSRTERPDCSFLPCFRPPVRRSIRLRAGTFPRGRASSTLCTIASTPGRSQSSESRCSPAMI